MKKITAISGFPEFLPEEQIVVNDAVRTIATTFESFGYMPLETPVVERVEHLLAKGIEGKEVYGLRRVQEDPGDQSAAELALRFDLTVPLARYVAQHYGQLSFPFRRYQIQPVWRGERPQAGRYRQFTQCDIDVIGDGSLSLEHDAEMPAVIFLAFHRLAFGKFTIRVNNRKILSGMFQSVGLDTDEQVRTAMHVIDDLEKIGAGKVIDRLEEKVLARAEAERLVEFFTRGGSNDEVMAQLEAATVNALYEQGVEELKTVIEAAPQNVPQASALQTSLDDLRRTFHSHFAVDLSIARGLDYYTGTVYETRLDAYPKVGSVCSGGRYENLAENLSNRQLPGVGISIGLTRLMRRLFDEGIIQAKRTTVAPVLVTVQNPVERPRYREIANHLRGAGIATEVYLQDRKLPVQLKHADRRNLPIVIIASTEELDRDELIVKLLETGEEKRMRLAQIPGFVRMVLPNDMSRD
jgi:histidyl-tRNA synthetase